MLALEVRLDQGVLAAEGLVERAPDNASDLDDLVDPHRPDTLGVEEIVGCLEESFTRTSAASGARLLVILSHRDQPTSRCLRRAPKPSVLVRSAA
jgi:hypothetical protein